MNSVVVVVVGIGVEARRSHILYVVGHVILKNSFGFSPQMNYPCERGI